MQFKVAFSGYCCRLVYDNTLDKNKYLCHSAVWCSPTGEALRTVVTVVYGEELFRHCRQSLLTAQESKTIERSHICTKLFERYLNLLVPLLNFSSTKSHKSVICAIAPPRLRSLYRFNWRRSLSPSSTTPYCIAFVGLPTAPESLLCSLDHSIASIGVPSRASSSTRRTASLLSASNPFLYCSYAPENTPLPLSTFFSRLFSTSHRRAFLPWTLLSRHFLSPRQAVWSRILSPVVYFVLNCLRATLPTLRSH